MYKFISGAILGLALTGTAIAPVFADVVGVHVGGLGVGIAISNGHYYDSHHRRQNYSYPTDWSTYHHPRSWYRSHPSWNDESNHDYYRN